MGDALASQEGHGSGQGLTDQIEPLRLIFLGCELVVEIPIDVAAADGEEALDDALLIDVTKTEMSRLSHDGRARVLCFPSEQGVKNLRAADRFA